MKQIHGNQEIAFAFSKRPTLTTLICLFFLLASGSLRAQSISLEQQQAPLKTVLRSIGLQSGYDVFYSAEDIALAKPVTIHLNKGSLKEALDRCFKDQPLVYSIEDKSIVVKRSPHVNHTRPNSPGKDSLPATNHVRVHVVDDAGLPLQGASVVATGGKHAGLTDANGDFSFYGLQPNASLEIKFVGYKDQHVPVDGKGLITVMLDASSNPLDQVQIIAYGTSSQRFNVGSVATVTSEDIDKQPITNPLLALQGKAPGLAVTATSGIPGSQVLLQVRGQNTLNNTLNLKKPYDQPLFIVDGVPFATQNNNVNQIASLVAAQGGAASLAEHVGLSPFNNIAPSDIESITILKDADATSIYGSQGANGVILITTKKGKAGATAFDLRLNTGFNSVGKPVKLLSTAQYLKLRRDAFAADGLTPSGDPTNYSAFAPDLEIFDQNKYTDWEKVIYGKNTNNVDVHGSVSGGDQSNTFILSAGYTRSNFNYPGDFSDQRYSLHSGLHHSSKDNRLSLDLTTDFGYEQNNAAGYGTPANVVFPPNLPELRNADGSLNWGYQGVDLTSYQFYASLLQPTFVQNYNFNTVFQISYNLLKNLKISANMGYNRNSTNENSQNPASAQNPSYAVRSATFSTNIAQTINIEPQINYNTVIGKGKFSALVGATYKKNPTSSTYTTGEGYANDDFLGSINGASTLTASDQISQYKYAAAFARLNYIYNNEFIINLTGRRDGSSNFGPGRRFGNFGSVGGGWIFTEQKALKNFNKVLSYGKLSGSYGTSGSDAAEAYKYQSLYQAIPFAAPFQGISPTYPYNLYNPAYSWATKKALNLALDLGFFNDRLLLNATYYRNREGNQLVNYPLAIQTGFSSVLGNLDATVQNKGWEFSISSTNIQSKDFTWSTTFNLSFNRNKLLSFPGLESSSYASQYAIGQPTTAIYGYKYKGVNPQTGLFEFYKADGTVSSSPKYGTVAVGGDQVVIGDREVKYMGGFGNTFSYKGLSLYIFCQFASQMAPNYLFQIYNSNLPGFINNEPTEILGKYWTAPGDQATLQRLGSSYSSAAINTAFNFGTSSGVYSDDNYLRIKTVSLSYQLPTKLTTKAHMKGASVFMNAQNLLTFTNYKVGDPEQPGNFMAFPLQRIIALGLDLKF